MALARASAHLVRAYLHPKRDEAAARPGDPFGTNVLRDVPSALKQTLVDQLFDSNEKRTSCPNASASHGF
jgi:hypothetical protein